MRLKIFLWSFYYFIDTILSLEFPLDLKKIVRTKGHVWLKNYSWLIICKKIPSSIVPVTASPQTLWFCARSQYGLLSHQLWFPAGLFHKYVRPQYTEQIFAYFPSFIPSSLPLSNIVAMSAKYFMVVWWLILHVNLVGLWGARYLVKHYYE